MKRVLPVSCFALVAAVLLGVSAAPTASASTTSLILESSCYPLKDPTARLIDLDGNELPSGTGYLAYMNMGDGTAKVFRPNPVEIAALVTEIRDSNAVASDSPQIHEEYWLAQSEKACRYDKEDKTCKGTCKRKAYKCVKLPQQTDQHTNEPLKEICNCRKPDA